MPSAFAHGLVGAGLAVLAPVGARSVRTAVVLAFVAVLPDLDVLGLRLGIAYAHPLGHRGLSHSLVFALAVGFAIALAQRRRRRERVALGILAGLACASHGLLDAFTDAGLGVGFFVPFHDGRYFSPWRPIATSPLSLRAFFGPSGLRVLANEALWVGLPTALLLSFVVWRRRALLPGGDSDSSLRDGH